MNSVIQYLMVVLGLIVTGHSVGQNPFIAQNQRCSSGNSSANYVTSSPGIAALIKTSWEQGCFYNASCPSDTASHATCLHVPSGDGAVAMAQIMKYYQFPDHGTGEHGYPHTKYGLQYANFGSTNYSWNTMPDSLINGNDGIATLMYQCGVAQNMNYGSVESTSDVNEIDSALVKYFSYPHTAGWKSKSDFSTAEWIAMLKAELDASHPLIYSGTDSSGSVRHYFICDGYQSDDQFHFNWGMGGAFDGYFYLNGLNPGTIKCSFDQRALFNLAPSAPAPGGFIMDFENVPDFSLTFNDWTVNDVDQHDTYGITGHSFLHQTQPMAFIGFNPAKVTPSLASDQAMQPHSGQRFGACFSSNPPSNNDWIISPQIQLGMNGSFSFWVKSYSDFWGLDTYRVAVSTTDNNPGSFTTISGEQPLQTTLTWTKKTFNLVNFNNQKIFVAINCVSNDHYMMMIDDLEVKPQASSTLAADFTSDKTSLKVGESVSFTDQSSGVPLTWSWKFPGGTPSTSTVQNPAGIRYSAPGIYPVSLRVGNGQTNDSVTKTAYMEVTGYPSAVSLDFESVTDFSLAFNPWTVIDVRSGNTYGFQALSFPHNYQPMAYICFNPAKTTPPLLNMQAHSGQKLGCSFSTTPPMNPNDKWLISPKLSLGIYPLIEFWVQSFNVQYGYEKYNVAVSVTDLKPSSFIPLNSVPDSAPATWTKRTYDLSAYSNQDVYVGIQCVTDTSFIFMIDDIFITSTVGVEETNSLERLVIYPNPANDLLTLQSPANGSLPFRVDLISIPGEKISSWKVAPVSGRIMLDIRKIPNGVYLLRVIQGNQEVTRKISINHQ